MTDVSCAACGSLAEGYKCSECGLESKEFLRSHLCGSDNVMPKCSICGEVEISCNCDNI